MDTQLELDRKALALFRQLLETTGGDRHAFELEAASLEPRLGEQERRLLELHRSETDRLVRGLERLKGSPELPPRLGAFTLVRELGRGGMGVVAEGQREAEGFTQRVAIKWIPAWQVDAARRQRFLFERDVVSRLRHPHIAQLVDGGEGEQGELWYAMELVEGEDLLEHCRERRLDLRARVGLVLDLCSAVSYAHRNLILHRDIKPSNVLVDREGQLKLIDFGIAKGLDDETEGLTNEAAPMTPRYAAPEQLRGERPTTATDVWQVAALAFELLTDQPVRKEGQMRRPSAAAIEAVRQNGFGDLDALGLPEALRGDIDAILSKALRESPEGRYASVDELASDFSAWLRGEAVSVRRHERWYATQRFLAVHRWAVGFGSLALVSLIALGGSSWWLMKRAQAEAQAAQRSNAVLSTVLLSFPGGNPQTMTLRDYIAHVVEAVVNESNLPAEVRGNVLNSLVPFAHGIAARDAAKKAARAAMESHQEVFGVDSVQAIRAKDVLILISAETATVEELKEFREQLLTSEAFFASLGPGFEMEYLDHLQARARVAAGLNLTEESLEILRKSVEVTARNPRASTEDHLLARATLSSMLLAAGKHSEAVEFAGETLRLAREAREREPEVPLSLEYFASQTCEAMSRAESPDAVAVCSALISDLAASGTLETPIGVRAVHGLAIAFEAKGETRAALNEYEQALQLLEKAGELAGPTHSMLVRGIGRQRYVLGDYAAALEAQRPLFDTLVKSGHVSGRWGQSVTVELAETLHAMGSLADARDILRSIVDEGALLPPKWHERWLRLSESLKEPP